MRVEPRKEKEASQMSGSWNDERVLVSCHLTNPICKWGEILIVWLRQPNRRPAMAMTHA